MLKIHQREISRVTIYGSCQRFICTCTIWMQYSQNLGWGCMPCQLHRCWMLHNAPCLQLRTIKCVLNDAAIFWCSRDWPVMWHPMLAKDLTSDSKKEWYTHPRGGAKQSCKAVHLLNWLYNWGMCHLAMLCHCIHALSQAASAINMWSANSAWLKRVNFLPLYWMSEWTADLQSLSSPLYCCVTVARYMTPDTWQHVCMISRHASTYHVTLAVRALFNM